MVRFSSPPITKKNLVFVAKVMAQMAIWEQVGGAGQGQNKHENQLAMSSRVLCGSAETSEADREIERVGG